MNKQKFLFEVGTEVCYKVGGIYTILKSKLEQTTKHFGENYILIGPWRGKCKHREFIPSSQRDLVKIKKLLAKQGIKCHVGYWNTPSKPKVILVDFKKRYRTRELLRFLQVEFGVDSSIRDADYLDSMFFSATAGEVIGTLVDGKLTQNKEVIAHLHEWMCGAGLLYLKKHYKNITTIFTTHATIFGRALAYSNKLVSDLPISFKIDKAARKKTRFAKASVEKASACEADYFTTVSKITAYESNRVLGRYPDKIIGNGLNIKEILKNIDPKQIAKTRKKLLEVARKVTKQKIDPSALLWITSGRYEFHNKGYDLLLKTLAKLEKDLPKDSPPIIMFFLVALRRHSKKDSLLNATPSTHPKQKNALGIATHKVLNPNKDGILKLCNKLNFKKSKRKIHIVFSDAYLNGRDGVFNTHYEQILASCNLSIFPSFYEPWGYTPLESLAYSVPTVTTDLSGFGSWVNDNVKKEFSNAAFVLKRKGKDEKESIDELKKHFTRLIKKSADKKQAQKIKRLAFKVASLADWKKFFSGYLEAYKEAIKFNNLC